MQALVTGGTGFIGRQVVDLLVKNGHAVRMLSRRPDVPGEWLGRGVTIAPGDLRDADPVVRAMRGAEVVFHIGEVRSTSAGNAALNVRVCEAMAGGLKAAGVRRIVFVSSLSVAGIPLAIPASEDTPAARVLRDQYTEYKRKAEAVFRQGSGGVEHVIIRPGIVYGPGSRHLGRLIDAVRRFGPIGIPFIGPGTNLMPLVHVEDLGSAIYRAGTVPGAAGRTLNLTDGERRTWAGFFGAVAAAQRKRLRLIPVHPALARVPALFVDLLGGVFGQSLDLPSLVDYVSRDVHYGAEQARSVLGWEPLHTDLQAAVAGMVAWYRDKAR